MHRRPKVELLPLDTELERTLRDLKKVRVVKSVAMVEQERTYQHIQTEPTTKRPLRQRTMEDFLEANH